MHSLVCSYAGDDGKNAGGELHVLAIGAAEHLVMAAITAAAAVAITAATVHTFACNGELSL